MATAINQLPSDPAVPKKENIILETPMYKNDLDEKQTVPVPMNNNDMSTMIGDIERASQQGLTQLNTGLEQSTMNVATDPNVTANHIPKQVQFQDQDYINNTATPENIVRQNTKYENQMGTLDVIFNELKIPLLVAVIYFIFQMPGFKSTIHKTFPTFFKSDANFNMMGVILMSGLFGVSYYGGFNAYNHIVKL